MPYFRAGWERCALAAGDESSRGCRAEAFKRPNGVADGALSFEAAFFDPDHGDEIDTMADLDEAARQFDGNTLNPPPAMAGQPVPASGRRSAAIDSPREPADAGRRE